MRIIIVIALLGWLTSCAEQGNSREPLLSGPIIESQTNQQNVPHTPEGSKNSVELDGDLVEVIKKGNIVHVSKLPTSIKRPLTLHEFAHPFPIRSEKDLAIACKDKLYKKHIHYGVTGIRAMAILNPFMEIDIRKAFNKKIFPKMVVLATGALKPSSSQVEISASYLIAAEISRIEEWLSTKISEDRYSLNFEAFATLDAIDSSNVSEPIMEIGRLICGIFDREASINFILTDNNGRRLTTTIDSVVFAR